MSDKILEPEGCIRIDAERDGVPAGVTLYFVFDGDWANAFNDEPNTEKEARQWFVQEVRAALEDKRSASSDSDAPAVGQASTEDRGE